MATTAILLFSHGSVLCGAEQSLLTQASRMEQRGDAPIVEVAFLNYLSPSFEESVERCVSRGASRIVVAPWFLVSGKFVQQELPPLIERVRTAHPALELVVAEALNSHPAIARAILSSAASARDPQMHRDVTEQAERFCRQSPDCPLFGTPDCPATEPTI